jgi:predicted CoA-substrate-specific enzyme activase
MLYPSDFPALIGLDVGSVNVKCVLLREGASGGDRPSGPAQGSWCRPSQGRPLEVVRELLDEVLAERGGEVRLAVTGSGKELLAGAQAERVNEVVAVATAVAGSYPEVRTIIDIGGQFTKWILVDPTSLDAPGRVEDFALNGLCAAGSGAFLEQQAGRLKLDLSELGELAAGAVRGATIAGRCSVFAKSDMIHLQQKGTAVDEIAYGLCLALARTFVSSVMQGRAVEPPLALVGGGAANRGLVRAFAEVLGLSSDEIFVPEDHLTAGARGAALGSVLAPALAAGTLLAKLEPSAPSSVSSVGGIPVVNGDCGAPLDESVEEPADLAPLTAFDRTRDSGRSEDPSASLQPGSCRLEEVTRAYMGVDVGSVSTNVVLLDEDQKLLWGLYLPTRGRPVEVLAEALTQLAGRYERLEILGVGTTGSGRHLAERLLGADLVKNEITAQLVSAAHYVPGVDTIIEIGGQDSKFIDAQGGHLRDFEMNKICAAGTGSFLEEQAERLGIEIIGQFSDRALASDRPRDLGTRCTVFMDTELCRAQAQGVSVEDICAGLAYSVARNYLDKVVAGRPIGETVVFQGGTASNQAVVAAFEQLLGRRVQVHPYNRISGAIGMALLAARDMERRGGESDFRGLGACADHTVTSFECKRCENRCQVNRVKAGGRKAHFGDVCERFTSRDRTDQVQARATGQSNLFSARAELLQAHLPEPGAPGRTRIGLPLATLHLELMPLWAHLLDELGFEPVFSSPSSAAHLARGVVGLPPEVCLPVKLTNGHVRELIEDLRVERVLLPTLLEVEKVQSDDRSLVCPFAHELPDMVRIRQRGRVLSPQVSLGGGPESDTETIRALAEALGVSQRAVDRALERGRVHQRAFTSARQELGSRRLASLERGVVVLGKPYNLHDPFANLNLARHLERLGLPALPMDLVPTRGEVLSPSWFMVPWQLNRQQVRALHVTARQPGIHPILVSNFGCGPDAFATKHLEQKLGARPRLFLEFDEHRGEAGLVTRLEAFADEIEEYERAGRHVSLSGRVARPDMVVENTTEPRRRVFVPNFYGHAHVFAGSLRALGHRVTVLPVPDAESVRMGEEVSNGRECHPYSLVAGELARLIRKRPVAEGDKFFIPGSWLACLMSQYGDSLSMMANGLDSPITVWDPHVGEMMEVFGMHGMAKVYDGLVCVDYLVIIGCQLRPREVVAGSVDETLERCFELLQETIAARQDVPDTFARCVARLHALDLGPAVDRPVVGVTGDLYSRVNAVGNGSLFHKLESMGCTVWPSPFFAGSAEYEPAVKALAHADRGSVAQGLREAFMGLMFRGQTARFAELLDDDLRELCQEPPALVLQEFAAPYCGTKTIHFVRDIVCKMVDFARRGADGVLSVAGLNCMVGISAAAMIPAIREDHGGLPMVALAYGGNEGPAQRIHLETFVHQVHQHHDSRRSPSAISGS